MGRGGLRGGKLDGFREAQMSGGPMAPENTGP